MRHPTQPPDHSRLIAAIVGVIVCFVGIVAWQADRENDTAIRIQMIATRSQ